MSTAIIVGVIALSAYLRETSAATGVSAPTQIVAAETVYADIARQIAGPDANVAALMTNPASDPHLFEPGPSAARALSGATIAIANGAGYEPWFDRLLSSTASTDRIVLRVSTLLGRNGAANPHLWVDPAAAPALASALTDALIARDGAHAAGYRLRRDAFLASLAPIDTAIGRLKQSLAGRQPPVHIAATEPVLGPLLDALGTGESDPAIAQAAQNGAEPAPAALARLHAALDAHQVTALIFNAQVLSPLSKSLRARAKADHIPTVAVAETLPAGQNYQHWMMATVTALAHASGAP